ncbi:MAG: luciferase family protein [Pseudomonadota bacterium]
MKRLHLTAQVVIASLVSGAVWGQSITLPERNGPRPQTTDGVPHVQIDAKPIPALSRELLRQVGNFKGMILEETRIGFPGSVGFNLGPELPVVRPDSIVIAREIAHMHPDGSLHAALDPQTAKRAIAKGWAIEHPWSKRRDGWEGFVMIYTPTTDDELQIVITLIEDSYRFITGVSPVN